MPKNLINDISFRTEYIANVSYNLPSNYIIKGSSLSNNKSIIDIWNSNAHTNSGNFDKVVALSSLPLWLLVVTMVFT